MSAAHTLKNVKYTTTEPNLCATRFTNSQNSSHTHTQSTAGAKRFKKLIEQAPDAFFSHDIHGNLIEVNEQTCQQLGYRRNEILTLNTRDIQRGIEPERAKVLWQKVMKGETVLTEDILLRKNGSTFPAEVKIGLFKEGNIMEI